MMKASMLALFLLLPCMVQAEMGEIKAGRETRVEDLNRGEIIGSGSRISNLIGAAAVGSFGNSDVNLEGNDQIAESNLSDENTSLKAKTEDIGLESADAAAPRPDTQKPAAAGVKKLPQIKGILKVSYVGDGKEPYVLVVCADEDARTAVMNSPEYRDGIGIIHLPVKAILIRRPRESLDNATMKENGTAALDKAGRTAKELTKAENDSLGDFSGLVDPRQKKNYQAMKGMDNLYDIPGVKAVSQNTELKVIQVLFDTHADLELAKKIWQLPEKIRGFKVQLLAGRRRLSKLPLAGKSTAPLAQSGIKIVDLKKLTGEINITDPREDH